jgi:alpha-L-fucosidase
MRKMLFITIASWLMVINVTIAQPTLSKDERMQWWREARFGMFIHWGVYAQLAGEYDGHLQKRSGAEWIMNINKIPVADYQQMAKQFNPVKFDADEWVRTAKNAGMKYIIITAKHHDGFALFKTNASKWNIVDATPYGKDILKPLAAACKKYGVKLGFYYSQAQDWNNGGSASRKKAADGWARPDTAAIDAYTKANKGHWDPVQTQAPFADYIDKVAVPEVKELLTNYGDVAVLWWDTPTDMTPEFALKFQALLKLQPNIITNDRLERPDFPGDTKTPEQRIPNPKELDGIDWETCMTMNGTWGFRATDHNWKSTETLIHNLCDIASKGGNYLLNVGPKADGTFPEESVIRLKEIGEWMKVNGEAIYATKRSPLPALDWGRCTQKADGDNTILYLEVFNWPNDGKLVVPGISNKIISAKILGTNGKCSAKARDSAVELSLPANAPNAYASVIKLVVSGKVGN